MSGLATRAHGRKRLYRRRRGRRENPYRKTKWGKGDFIKYAGYAYTALKIAKGLKKLVNVEMKHYDKNSTGQNMTDAGTIYTVNDVSQGDTDLTRDGDSLKNQSVQIKIQCNANSNQQNNGRVIVFWDKENKTSATTDLLETADPFSFKAYDTRFQTKVLWDKRIVFSSTAVENGQIHTFDINLPLGAHTQFEAGTTTINTGALKILFLSDQNATNYPTYSVYSRLLFTDN